MSIDQRVPDGDDPSAVEESPFHETPDPPPLELIPGGKKEHHWQPEDLIQLAANPPEPPTIGGMLYPGSRTVLSGETESMKTWLALILCKAELEIGLTVCWIDLDAMGPASMLLRLRLLGVDDKAIQQRFLYYRPDKPLDDRHTEPLAEIIYNHQIRLCVIDAFNPFLSMHDLDPNSTTDVEKFWQLHADPICDAGAAPVLLDHVVKNTENRGKYAYGSERKASGAIVHIGFKSLEILTQGGSGRSLLTVHKDRPGYLQRPTLGRLIMDATGDFIEYAIQPDQSHNTDDGGFRPTVLMEKISRQLERETEPLSTKQIEDIKIGKADYVRKALTALAEGDYLARHDGAHGAKLYTTIRPFREADQPTETSSSRPRPNLVPNLTSCVLVPRPHPLGDEDEPQRRPQDDDVLVPQPGQPIHEYDIPPIPEYPGDPDDTDDFPF